MKAKVIIALVLTAVVTLSFTASSVKEKKSPAQQEVKTPDSEPVGGLSIEDKL